MNQQCGSAVEPGTASDVLSRIYEAWDAAVAREPVACAAGCAVCCTDRVSLGWIEAWLMFQRLESMGRGALIDVMAASQPPEAARPRTSANQVAAMCIQGLDPPEEPEPEQGPGRCALLDEHERCLVYDQRPLACRIMLSRQRCQAGGEALQSDWLLTLGLCLSQLVEQCSAGRPYGLLADLAALARGERRPTIICRDLPGLAAPPRHQSRLEEFVRALMARPCPDGRPVGLWLGRLRVGD